MGVTPGRGKAPSDDRKVRPKRGKVSSEGGEMRPDHGQAVPRSLRAARSARYNNTLRRSIRAVCKCRGGGVHGRDLSQRAAEASTFSLRIFTARRHDGPPRTARLHRPRRRRQAPRSAHRAGRGREGIAEATQRALTPSCSRARRRWRPRRFRLPAGRRWDPTSRP